MKANKAFVAFIEKMAAGLSKSMTKKQKGHGAGDEDWENHLVIRFPSDVTPVVNEIISLDAPANDRLAVNFEMDMRNGAIRVDNRVLPFKIYDLPCVTEVMKTVDKKTLYKVTDLSQIIICSASIHKDVARVRHQSGGSSSGESNSRKEVQWPHGLTPPMKNARKCRFRKTKKKKYMDAPDVERELKRLLRSDLDAQSIRWEVMPIEQKDVTRSNGSDLHQRENIEEMTEEKVVRLLDSLSDSENDGAD